MKFKYNYIFSMLFIISVLSSYAFANHAHVSSAIVDESNVATAVDVQDEWKTISGTVTYNGLPVCAIVLVNGQYTFSCVDGEDFGKYELRAPLDSNSEVTIQVFVSGLAPFRQVAGGSNLRVDVAMQIANPDSPSPEVTTVNASDASTPLGWTRITGSVGAEGTPLCAMVLANGQYMFSCGPNNGVYDLTIPLDDNGQITLYVFVSGKQPFKQTFTP